MDNKLTTEQLLSKIWSWGEQPCYEHLDIPVPKEVGGGFIHKNMRRRRRCSECWNKLLSGEIFADFPFVGGK